MTSKQVKTTYDIRLLKPELCKRYIRQDEWGVFRDGHTNETGKNIDHIIELQIIVKALEYCAEYKRKTWKKDLRSASNNVNNLQPSPDEENEAKRAAVTKWLSQWPQKSATEYFRGDDEKYLNQIKEAWIKLKPVFMRKKLKSLSQTLEKMINGPKKLVL